MSEGSPTATAPIEPRQTKITARLNAQGALLQELRTVVAAIKPETARTDFRRAVLEENVLQRPSLGSRVDVYEKLSVRYFPSEARRSVDRLVRAMQSLADPIQSGLIAYVMLLWNDALVFLLGCEWLAPRLAGPPFEAETHDIERELERLSEEVHCIGTWTPGTRKKVSAHYLGLLRDFGYATGSLRKRLRRPYISPDVILFGAQLVVGGGEPASRLPEHPLFTAMGLSVEDVVNALTELRGEGRVDFALQGGVTHFALREEVAG